jgi:hypothetical protein
MANRSLGEGGGRIAGNQLEIDSKSMGKERQKISAEGV